MVKISVPLKPSAVHCNPYQNPSFFFFLSEIEKPIAKLIRIRGNRKALLKILMGSPGMPSSQNNLGKQGRVEDSHALISKPTTKLQ